MTDQPTIPGTFDVIEAEKIEDVTTSPLAANAARNAKNPIALAHLALMRELAPMAVPKIHVNPDPGEFEDVADYLIRMAKIFDRWLHEVGGEVLSSSTARLDARQFDGVFEGAISGNATHECDHAAEVLREDNDEARHQRQPRSSFADDLFEDMQRLNRALYGR